MLVVGSELAPSDAWIGPLALAGKVVRIDVDPVAARHERGARTSPCSATPRSPSRGCATGSATASPTARAPRAGARASGTRPREDGARWADVLGALGDALGDDGVLAADQTMVSYYGAVSALPAQRPRSFLFPTGYGTLGYAVPAAIGAKLGRPDARVAALAGDGGVLFSVTELAAAAQEGLAVPVVIVDNSGYGEIRNEMRDRGDEPLGVDFPGLDFAALGRALNCHGAARRRRARRSAPRSRRRSPPTARPSSTCSGA